MATGPVLRDTKQKLMRRPCCVTWFFEGWKVRGNFCKVDLLYIYIYINTYLKRKIQHEPYPPSRSDQHLGKLQRYAEIMIVMLLSDFIIAKESFVLKDSNEHFQDAKA